MAQLKTTFAGLTLNNPIIISSSGLTNSLAKIQKLEEAGAGAVVLKSVFEEQINMQGIHSILEKLSVIYCHMCEFI